MEQWVDVKGYEGLYQISSEGRLRSLDMMVLCTNGKRRRLSGRVLKPRKNPVSGYIQYLLCEDGVKRYFYAHRLVAMAFIPNLEDLPEVNHINEVKTDNRVENLEWCDSKYNNNFGTKNKRGNANNDRKYCEQNRKLVNQYDLDGNLVATFEGMRVASKATGVLEQSISKCCRGLISQTAGTKWAYA